MGGLTLNAARVYAGHTVRAAEWKSVRGLHRARLVGCQSACGEEEKRDGVHIGVEE